DWLLGEASPGEIVQSVEIPVPQLPTAVVGSSNGEAPPPGIPRPTHVNRILAVIPAGSPAPETAALLASARFAEFMREIAQAYELVVIDSSPLLSVADTPPVILQASATLVCVRARRTTREEA